MSLSTTDCGERPVTDPHSAFDSALKQVIQMSKEAGKDVVVAERLNFNLATWSDKTTGGLKDSVFEWGLGESSFVAAEVGVPRHTGIDSDPTWMKTARDKSPDHFCFYLGDAGPTGCWGRPVRSGLGKAHLNCQSERWSQKMHSMSAVLVGGWGQHVHLWLSFMCLLVDAPKMTSCLQWSSMTVVMKSIQKVAVTAESSNGRVLSMWLKKWPTQLIIAVQWWRCSKGNKVLMTIQSNSCGSKLDFMILNQRTFCLAISKICIRKTQNDVLDSIWCLRAQKRLNQS